MADLFRSSTLLAWAYISIGQGHKLLNNSISKYESINSQLQSFWPLFNVFFVLIHVSDNFFAHSSAYLWVRGCQTIIWDNVIKLN
jgi:hypothetical protein